MRRQLCRTISVSGNQWPSGACRLAVTLSHPLSISSSFFRACARARNPTTSGVYTLLESTRSEGCRPYTRNSLTSLKYCHQHEDHCFRASLLVPSNRPINHLEKPPPGTADCILFVQATQEAQFLRTRFAASRSCVDWRIRIVTWVASALRLWIIILHFAKRVFLIINIFSKIPYRYVSYNFNDRIIRRIFNN